MELYHFCSAIDMPGIRSQGITKGYLPMWARIINNGKPGKYQPHFVAGWQWLTLDGDHDRQSWATKQKIMYNRTDYRWTVEIPEREETQLYDRSKLFAIYAWSDDLFEGWSGSENWRIYRGYIPKRWLKKLEKWNDAENTWEEIHYGR